MKIITKAVYNMSDWSLIHEESFDYEGEISLCGGGGGKGSSSPPPPPPPAPPVQKLQTKPVTEAASSARENQKQKSLRAKGIKSTILTKQNDTNSNSAKTLLGQ